jgi:transcriptional regulator with XRE-family HTH domain
MPNKTNYGVWKELRVLRERTGWKSADLSKEADIGKGYLSDLENGNRWPNATVTKKLADALKVPYSVLERPAAEQEDVA